MKDCSITEIPENTADCSDEEDGPYIEIELESTSAPPTCYNDGVEQEQEDECQLRISISSTISVSLPEEVQKESTNINQSGDQPKVAANAIGAPSCISSLMSCSADEAGFEVEFPVQNRLFSTVSFYPRPIVSWESPQPDAQTTIQGTTRVIPCDHADVLHSRYVYINIMVFL